MKKAIIIISLFLLFSCTNNDNKQNTNILNDNIIKSGSISYDNDNTKNNKGNFGNSGLVTYKNNIKDLYLKEYGFYGVIEDENGKTYDGYDVQISQNFTIATDVNGKDCKTKSMYFPNIDNLEASQHGIINLFCLLSENTKYKLNISKDGKIIKTFDFITGDKKTLTIGKDEYNTFLFGIYSLDKISYLFSDEVKKKQEELAYNNPDYIEKSKAVDNEKLFTITFYCNSKDVKRKLNDGVKYEMKNKFNQSIEKGLISEQMISFFLYPGDDNKIILKDGSEEKEIKINYDNDNNSEREILLKNCDDSNSKIIY